MFDKINKQSCRSNNFVPVEFQLNCKYCKEIMLQLNGKWASGWPSFICPNCGGKCTFECRKEYVLGEDGIQTPYLDAKKVMWSKRIHWIINDIVRGRYK